MVFGESRWKDVYRLAVWGPYRQLLALSPAGTELAANRALARLAHRALPAKRAALRAQMSALLGEREDLDDLVRRAFEVHFLHQYAGFVFPKVRVDTYQRYLDLTGVEHLDAALQRRKGVVVAHAHMGMPQLPLHVLGLCGYDVHQVGGGAPAVTLSLVGKRAAAMRSRLEDGIEATLHDARGYLRPVLRAIAGNGVVFTACDGTGGGEEYGRREVHTVLGHPMRLPPFPAWLARKSGATLLALSVRSSASSTSSTAPFRATLAPIEATPEALAVWLDREIRASPADWHFWDAAHEGPGGLFDSSNT